MRKKPVAFVGDSKDRLRNFLLDAKREVGVRIDKIQSGDQPDDFSSDTKRWLWCNGNLCSRP